MRHLAHWLLLAGAAPLSPAIADSDGLMCVGPKYLALESRSFDSDGQHRLFIYWLHDGIGPKLSVQLPDFQAHALDCTASTVQLRGWDEIHEVDVSKPYQPRYVGPVPSVRADQPEARRGPQNIAAWPSGRLDLSEVSDGTHFALHVSNSPEIHPGIVEWTTIVKLVRLSSDDSFIASRIIYAATSVETVD